MKQQLDLPLCDILKASRPISPKGSFLYLSIVLIGRFLVGDISSQSLRPIIFYWLVTIRLCSRFFSHFSRKWKLRYSTWWHHYVLSPAQPRTAHKESSHYKQQSLLVPIYNGLQAVPRFESLPPANRVFKWSPNPDTGAITINVAAGLVVRLEELRWSVV